MSDNAKETIYDERISPLMVQIIAIAKEQKIPFHASFDLSDDPDDDFRCTSHYTDNSTHPQFRADYDPLERRVRLGATSNPLMVTIRDGDGKVKEMHAYVG